MTVHSIFQLHPNSPLISAKDVHHAFNKTRRMTPHNKLKYFHQKGMHYSRCVKYIKIVENLQTLYDNDHIEQQTQDLNIINQNNEAIKDIGNHKMSIQEIGKFIEELLKDTDES
jgi:CMP-N-acetylneuraminic acid synthetase